MTWQEQLMTDPTELLMSLENEAINYFTSRDLLDEKVEPITTLWELPEVEKL